MNELELKYYSYEEPVRGLFLALRDILLAEGLKDCLKYGCICFTYKDKVAVFVMRNKKQETYLLCNYGRQLKYPLLSFKDRKSMQSLALDAEKDIPIEAIEEILSQIKTIIDVKFFAKKK